MHPAYIDVATGFVVGLARRGGLHELPYTRQQIIDKADPVRHADVVEALTAAPPFIVQRTEAGDVGLRVDGVYVRVWPRADLRRERAAWRVR